MTFKQVQEETKDVFALLCERDKKVLYKYAAKVPENGVIVDIGTARGGSALIMSLASKPSVKIYTFDPTPHIEEMIDLITKFNLKERLFYFVKTSEEMYHDWDREIDMLFIDGRHNYDGVMDDYNLFGRKVKKGGIIAFHDVKLYANTIGAAVKDLIKSKEIEHIETIVDYYREDIRKIGLFVGRKL